MKNQYKEPNVRAALVCTIVLFSASFGYAQTKDSKTVSMHIEKEVNGEAVTFDTIYTTTKDDFKSFVPNRPGAFPPIRFFPPDPVPRPDPIPPPPHYNIDTLKVHYYYLNPGTGAAIITDDQMETDALTEEMENLSEKMKNMRIESNEFEAAEFPGMSELRGDGNSFNESFFDLNDGNVEQEVRVIIKEDGLADTDHLTMRSDDDDESVFEKNVGTDGHHELIYKRIILKDNTKGVVPGVKDKMNGSALNDLNIYPNPSEGKFNLNFHADGKGDLKIRVTDIDGREIFSQQYNDFTGSYNNSFDLSEHGKGIYILSIEQNNSHINQRIVIN